MPPAIEEAIVAAIRAGYRAAAKACGNSQDYYIERAEGWLEAKEEDVLAELLRLTIDGLRGL